MAEWCGEHNIEVWAYCLMPNHVHLIVVPQGAERVSLEQRWRAHQAEG